MSFRKGLSSTKGKEVGTVGESSGSNSNNNEDNELLAHVLKQLRPFQREAYDFAAKGLTYGRQCSTSTDGGDGGGGGYGKKSTSSSSSSKIARSTSYDRNLLGKGRILLADEMGLGKTVTSLAIMAHYYPKEWPLLILCPASLRHTWPGEIEKFLPSLPPSSIYVVQGYNDADFYENVQKRRKINIVVASYSLLQNRSAAARCLQQFEFQSVIADESHNLKQPKTQRTLLAQPLLSKAKRLVLLSGTPALARPVELWTQVQAIAPNLFAKTYTEFTKRYCNARRGRFGWDVNGLSNPDELHAKLKQIMVRRLKSDVLHELPAKQRSIVPITIPKGSKERRECQAIIQELKETRKSVSQLVGDEADSAHFEARTLLMQAYQASGIAKVANGGVCDYIVEWLHGSMTQKALIFAHHKGVLDAIETAIAKLYKGRGHIRIDGSVPSQERAVRVKKFQNSSHIRVAILSMTAAGVGLTLTAASTVMFAELHWTPGVLAQAEDRCHRIGQRNAVHVQYLVCNDRDISVDMQLWDMLGRKIGTLGRVIDGEKNAHMNAEVARPDQQQQGPRQSVQDELQSFFAETSLSQNEKDSKHKTPVKGSIMSFFQKQNQRQQKSSAKKVSSSLSSQSDTQPSSSRSTNAASVGDTSDDSIRLPYFASKQQQKTSKNYQWACDACTYLNRKILSGTLSSAMTTSRFLSCEMCGGSHQPQSVSPDQEKEHQKRPSPTVTPTPTSTSRKKAGKNYHHQQQSHSTYSNDIVLLDDDILPSPVKGKEFIPSTQSSSSSEDDPIVIDGPNSTATKPTHSSHEKPIVLLDDNASSSSCSYIASATVSTPFQINNSNDLIEIDEKDEHLAPVKNSRPSSSPNNNGSDVFSKGDYKSKCVQKVDSTQTKRDKSSSLLSFSVSRNSGRITLHYAATGKSTLTNFELEQIMSEECSDSLMHAQISRKSASSKTLGIPIEFNHDAIDRVIKALDHSEFGIQYDGINCGQQLNTEIKEFVRNYLQLREVEKKAIRESERPFYSSELKRAVLSLMASSSAASSKNVAENCNTERYAGGARERARQRIASDVADDTDMAILEGRLCAWCGGSIPTVFQAKGVDGGTYCRRECAERGRLNTSSGIRAQIFALEGGVCRFCGIDAFALFQRILALQPAERLNALCNANWTLPKSPKALERLLSNPKEGDFWEADHIQAVAEGGGSCGLDNIRTLCVPCHQEETRRLHHRLKLNGGSCTSSFGTPESRNNKRQRDIRSMFKPVASQQTNSAKRRHQGN